MNSNFTQQEQDLNVERGKIWLEHGLKPYMGEFREIDLNQEWYCPNCRTPKTKLVLGRNGRSLHCPTFHEICEYEYGNKEERDLSGTFLSDNYQWPITILELKKDMLSRGRLSIASWKDDRARLLQMMKEQEQKNIELEAEILAIEGQQT